MQNSAEYQELEKKILSVSQSLHSVIGQLNREVQTLSSQNNQLSAILEGLYLKISAIEQDNYNKDVMLQQIRTDIDSSERRLIDNLGMQIGRVKDDTSSIMLSTRGSRY